MCCVCECYKGVIVVMNVIWHLLCVSVSRGSISSELIMGGGGVCSMLLLPLVDRCLKTIDVCIWHMFVLMSVVVSVWGLWECLLCSGRC